MTTGERRPYKRAAQDVRRDAMIAAALKLISQGGIAAATVRAIAEKAGVTPGLIRHYYKTKEDLTRAAYQTVMDRMTAANAVVLDTAPGDAEVRLADFVCASLRPPVVDPAAMGLWAGFIHLVQSDPAFREVHRTTYLGYRDLLQSLIAALPRKAGAAQLRAEAIACNGLIDGLWLEACALPEAFVKDELAEIGVRSVGAILGVDLLAKAGFAP